MHNLFCLRAKQKIDGRFQLRRWKEFSPAVRVVAFQQRGGGSIQTLARLIYNAATRPNGAFCSQGRALLHWACDRGHKELVSLLLQHKADINSQVGRSLFFLLLLVFIYLSIEILCFPKEVKPSDRLWPEFRFRLIEAGPAMPPLVFWSTALFLLSVC